jgi:hypothetical protein
MADLSWQQEPDRLRKARHIVCEVPELLLEILEHDYGRDFEGPEEPIEIRYYHGDARHVHSSGYSMKGAAWAHLQKNPPILVVRHGGETERFMPVFETKYNPYRKKHSNDYWCWFVLRWELIPPDGDKSSGESHE